MHEIVRDPATTPIVAKPWRALGNSLMAGFAANDSQPTLADRTQRLFVFDDLHGVLAPFAAVKH